MKELAKLLSTVSWIIAWAAGAVIAKGFWSTFFAATTGGFWSLYLVVERVMQFYGMAP